MPYQGVAFFFLVGFGLATAAFLYFLNDQSNRQQEQPHRSSSYQADYEPVNSWTRPPDNGNNTNNSARNNRRRRRSSVGREPCAVCFESIQPTAFKRLTCDHVFHVECITQWLQMKPECPVCRRRQY